MVLGRTRENSLDQRESWPVFEAAEALRAPHYLYPQSPPRAVRDAYYRVENGMLSTALSGCCTPPTTRSSGRRRAGPAASWRTRT